MKKVGKIAVMFISLFVLSAIFWFINLENGGEGISAIGLFITIGFSWFISYSKWANDNIWNTKTSKSNSAPNISSEKVVEPIDGNKTPKEVNKNLNPDNNNTLLYVIIGLLVVILVIVIVRNPEPQQTKSNNSETIERETIPKEQTNSNTPTVEKQVQSTTKKTNKYQPSSNDLGNLKGYHIDEVFERERVAFYKSKPYRTLNFYLKSTGNILLEGIIYNDFGIVTKLRQTSDQYNERWVYNEYDNVGNVMRERYYRGIEEGHLTFEFNYDTDGIMFDYSEFNSIVEGEFYGAIRYRWFCDPSYPVRYKQDEIKIGCRPYKLWTFEVIGWNNEESKYDVRFLGERDL